ncbi:hypothetical protein CVT26_003567 [Gymnopilus dilepis]|uniref:Uncharacterized protein n=1 Tax=Gymnopilus dilepis TaxID=231916 RepID=A0A409VSA9_9AGAR|nr:hypothetical protein CVT26_003567 [Gymnopilus dilepis]
MTGDGWERSENKDEYDHETVGRLCVEFDKDYLTHASEAYPTSHTAMNDNRFRCAVFCIAPIPTATLNLFLACVQEYLEEIAEPDFVVPVSSRIVLIDSKDISTITKGSSPPITSCPTDFFGYTLREVCDWFNANIGDPCAQGYMSNCFFVLDDQSAEDDTCVFACPQEAPPGGIHSLRCGFEVAMVNAITCGIQGRSIEEGVMGRFMRSGVTMTKENLELANNRGRYIEDGEVKVNEAWKNFSNW